MLIEFAPCELLRPCVLHPLLGFSCIRTSITRRLRNVAPAALADRPGTSQRAASRASRLGGRSHVGDT